MKTIKELEAEIIDNGCISWSEQEALIYQLKDVLEVIDKKIKMLKAKQKEADSQVELYGLEYMIAGLKEIKKRIIGDAV